MPAGRPTKYKKEYCETVPALMAKGMAKVEVCAELGIDYHTFLSWQDKHKKFLQSVKKGDDLSKAWWMSAGRENLKNPHFSYTGWYMNMKNRHGWADKHEIEIGGLRDLGIRLADALKRRETYDDGK